MDALSEHLSFMIHQALENARPAARIPAPPPTPELVCSEDIAQHLIHHTEKLAASVHRGDTYHGYVEVFLLAEAQHWMGIDRGQGALPKLMGYYRFCERRLRGGINR